MPTDREQIEAIVDELFEPARERGRSTLRTHY
jgi:hypothetical protein